MEEKEYDLFMNVLRNPDISLGIFLAAGLDTSNTQLLSKEEYASSDKVKEALRGEDGLFDLKAFDLLYNNALFYYNVMASLDYDKAMESLILYHRDNIFAPVNLRRSGPDFQYITMSNPYKLSFGIIELGKTEERTKSIDELALANHILLNPTTAGDNLENAKWGDSPNDSFFEHFFDTLVLALYDNDGTHKDPISGEIVEHKKGDLKLDLDGNFYYETLDGRDVYSRRVLNKMNILTTDDSKWNQYDFFDSDDLELKSIGGSIMKNLALVGSMFVPYVGPWIAGLSIATLLAGLGAILGKMLTGSDNPLLSEIEGWAKSVSRQGAQTEYAQLNTWCWENFINLIGDVVGLIYELRFIFKQIPYFVSGTNIYSKESVAAKLAQLERNLKKLFDTKVKNLSPTRRNNLGLSISELRELSVFKAQSELQSFIKGNLKLGEILSKGYMTAVTVGDTYGEAKNAGASDLDATLLTLGYAAGEYALLSTGLGKWILPELREGRYKAKAIVDALTNTSKITKDIKPSFKMLPKEKKKEYVKRMFDIGKSIARSEYEVGLKTIPSTLMAGVSEGLEETSEELLADFSKGCYDVVKWLLGDDTRINTFGYDFSTNTFDSSLLIDRYSMSLIGGFIGGGIANTGINYKSIKDYKNMTSELATLELIYMARNGLIDKFLKDVNSLLLGDKNLSILPQLNSDGTLGKDENGNILLLPANEKNNLDTFIKSAVTLQVNLIKLILQANGAAISDDSFLDKQILNDLRFTALQNSSVASNYLNEFNGLCSDIVRLTKLVNEALLKSLDSNNNGAVSDKEKRENTPSINYKKVISDLESKLKEKLNQLLDLLNGNRSYEFIADALFELTPALNSNISSITFSLFAELYYSRKYSELTENEKAVAYEKYKAWKQTEGREHIKEISAVFRNLNYQVSDLINRSAEDYKLVNKVLKSLNTLISAAYGVPEGSNKNGVISEYYIQAYLNEASTLKLKEISSKRANIDLTLSKEEILKLEETIDKELDEVKADILLANIDDIIRPYLDLQFINKESKNYLLYLLNRVNSRNTILASVFDDEAELLGNWDAKNPYIEKSSIIKGYIDSINKLNETPLELNFNQYTVAIGKNPVSISELLDKVNSILKDTSDDTSKFYLKDEVYGELLDAINLLKMYRASILAARVDNASVGDLYGYNATLNELGKDLPKLAEIDSQTADMFISDIDTNLNKLIYLKNIYEFNRGQKLTRNDRVATKKSLLIYKRLHSLVQVPENDELTKWEGFLLLQNVVNSLTLHLSVTNNVSEEQQELFERENILLEDAIFEFFQKNLNKLNDVDELAKLLNPSRLLLYTEAKELLNENLNDLDDNSIIWWMASRAAVKASDFYNLYKLILDPETSLAPIAPLELAIYNNYASVINGNVFSNFYKAYRQALLKDWKSKTVDLRREIAKKLGIDEIFTPDNMVDYAMNFLPIPKYGNIVFTEGVPGAGKTSNIYGSTIKLLLLSHRDLLRNVAVVHGGSLDSAVGLKKDLKLDTAKAFDMISFMKEISPDWKPYLYNPTTDTYTVPKKDYMIDNEGAIRSSLSTLETTTPFSLVIIDEISKFTAYDLDLINDYAKKYGITVLVAGDFDLSGVVGGHSILLNGQEYTWKVHLNRTDFIRVPKLGISMRTDNSIKTENTAKLQAYMLNPQGDPPTFLYYKDNTGLYGDLVLSYSWDIYRNEDGEITGEDKDKNSVISFVLSELDDLIKTLKPGLKIGYIYSDRNSPIFKELSSDKYSQYIDFKFGNSALGLESLYYIIEADFNPNTNIYLKGIYTGMSRALLGSIIISPTGSDKKIINFKSELVLNKIEETLSKATIAQYTTKRRQLLESLVPSGNPIQYVPRIPQSTVVPKKESKGLQAGIDPLPSYELLKKDLIKLIGDFTTLEELDRFMSDIKNSKLRADQDIRNTYNNKKLELSLMSYELEKQLLLESIEGTDDVDGLISRLTLKHSELLNDLDIIDAINKKKEHKPITAKKELAEPDFYSDNLSPITDTDIISEKEYKEDVDISTLGPEIQEASFSVELDDISINMNVYSFNTLETGVQKDANGYPFIPDLIVDGQVIPGKNWMDRRIDSVNGMVKIDAYKSQPIKKVDEYVELIGDLRNILFNTKDKSEICSKIENYLGLQNVYCTFALKSSPRSGDKNKAEKREFVDSKPSPFSKGISEKTLFNGSSDIRSDEWHLKSIVAIIGTKETGDILELPLLALTSPFTLLKTKENGKHVFPLMYSRYTQLLNLPEHEIVVTLIQEFDRIPQYLNLVNLFKVYDFTDGGIFYIRDLQWTPLRNLELLGPLFALTRGYYLGTKGLNYNAEWATLDDYAHNPLKHNPLSTITSKVMVSLNGMVDAGDKTILIANAGHPFVLVAYDKTLNTDKKIVDYYVRLKTDSSVLPKVLLAYVIPPHATIAEYVDNLHKRLVKDSSVLAIGHLFTSYKLLKILLNNEEFRQILNKKVPGLTNKVEEVISELDTLETILEKKDKLFEPLDWSAFGFSSKPVALSGLLDNVLVHFAYNRNTVGYLIGLNIRDSLDTNALKVMETVLSQNNIDRVYYNTYVSKSNPQMIGPFHVPILSKNYSINNKPFLIHGKIDSYTYRGNFDTFIEYVLSRMIPSGNGHIQSLDSSSYFHRNSNIGYTITNSQQRAISNTLLYLYQKTGKDFTEFYENTDIQSGNRKVVQTLQEENNDLVAFMVNGLLKVSDRSKYLQGYVFPIDSDGNPCYELEETNNHPDNNGNYTFTLEVNPSDSGLAIYYDATYDSKNDTLTITPLIETKNSNITLSASPENIANYLNEGREILESIFDFDPTLSDAFLKTTYEEFILALNDLEYIGEDRINDLLGLLEDATPELKLIINDLIELEKSHDPYKLDVNDESQICPPSFKINL